MKCVFTKKQLSEPCKGERIIPLCLRNRKMAQRQVAKGGFSQLKTEFGSMGGTWWHNSWEGIVKVSGSKVTTDEKLKNQDQDWII